MHTDGTVASAYDTNGNIKHLKREVGGTVADNLSYTYSANRLLNITDAGSVTALFKDVNNAQDYDYDLAGNMKTDNNKGVNVKYNYLNLPYEITKTGDAAGKIKHYYVGAAKARMEVYEADGTTLAKTYDYLGGMVYVTIPEEAAELDFIGTPEGRALLTRKVMGTDEDPILGDKFKYEYSLKDHLGNLRVSCRCNEPERDLTGKVIAEGEPGAGFIALAVVQENHYDPWGLLFGADEPPVGAEGLIDKYGYNGKEQLLDLDLDWMDYGARQYVPEFGRFTSIDRFSEKEKFNSNYIYAANNGIRFIDINGDSTDKPSSIWQSVKAFWQNSSFSSFTKMEGEVTLGARIITNPHLPTFPRGIKNVDEVDINANSAVLAKKTIENDKNGLKTEIITSNKEQSFSSQGVTLSATQVIDGIPVSATAGYENIRDNSTGENVDSSKEFGVNVFGMGINYSIESSPSENVYRLSTLKIGIGGGVILTGSFEYSLGYKLTIKK